MNVNDIFYICLGIIILGLVIFGYRMPLDDSDKKIFSAERNK